MTSFFLCFANSAICSIKEFRRKKKAEGERRKEVQEGIETLLCGMEVVNGGANVQVVRPLKILPIDYL